MRSEDKEAQVNINKLFSFMRTQIDPMAPIMNKISLLTESCLKENRTYFDYKKKLYTLENGFEKQMFDIIKKFEANSQGGGFSVPIQMNDYVLQSKNTVDHI